MIKIVRESLLEFHQTGDPLNSLNIGISNITNFKDINEFIDYIIIMLPTILNCDKIPYDIIIFRGVLIKDSYFKKIVKFLILKNKIFKIKGKEFIMDPDGDSSIADIWYILNKRLNTLGF